MTRLWLFQEGFAVKDTKVAWQELPDLAGFYCRSAELQLPAREISSWGLTNAVKEICGGRLGPLSEAQAQCVAGAPSQQYLARAQWRPVQLLRCEIVDCSGSPR